MEEPPAGRAHVQWHWVVREGGPVCARAVTCPVVLSIPFLPCWAVALSVVCGTSRCLEAGREQVPSYVCVWQVRSRVTEQCLVSTIGSLPYKTPVLS